MRAALLSAPHVIEIVDRPDPTPGPGEATLRVGAASICGSDLAAYRGYHEWVKPPTILGHECAGTVVAVGTGVRADLVDTIACVEPNICCGTCKYCTAGLPNICPYYRVLGESLDLAGAHAEYVNVPAGQLYTLPASVPAGTGTLVQPLAISYEGTIHRGNVQAGDRVLIVGAGPIGLGALMLSRLRGAEVAIVDVVDYRVELADRLGAEIALRADDPDLDAAVLEWTGGLGADIAIEAVGGRQNESLLTAVRLTAARGRIVVVGSFADPTTAFPVAALKKHEQVLLGSHGHPASFQPVIELISDGRLRPQDMVSHAIPLDDIAEAFRMMDEKVEGVVKVVVHPN